MTTISNKLLRERASQFVSYVQEVRGYLHENPEVSGREYETSSFLQKELNGMGLPVQRVSETGLLAVLETGRPGPTVALRADIDALPMSESPDNLLFAKKFVSKRQGVAHTCGHDGHMAMLLGAARVLCQSKDSISGRVLFCFEEGEETGSGIGGMMQALSQYDVSAVWGIHLTSFMETGTISVDPGPRMAGETQVHFEVLGKGGHGSRPDLSINPVFAAAHVLTALGSAWPNRIDANETVTLGIATINGGTAPNIIPDHVKISGTLRFFNVREGAKAVEVLKHVATHAAKAHMCDVRFDDNAFRIGPPVINDAELSEFAARCLRDVLPAGAVVSQDKWYASESFRNYGASYPAVLAFVGARNLQQGMGAEHHNVHFDIDEGALELGLLATVKFATEMLGAGEVQERE